MLLLHLLRLCLLRLLQVLYINHDILELQLERAIPRYRSKLLHTPLPYNLGSSSILATTSNFQLSISKYVFNWQYAL